MEPSTKGRTRYSLTEEQLRTLEQICEWIVPGSAPAGPAIYLDSSIANMGEAERDRIRAFLDAAAAAIAAGAAWQDLADRPDAVGLRELAIEAYYGDFRQPGYEGPGAWRRIGFDSAPMAARTKKDWSFLACCREDDDGGA